MVIATHLEMVVGRGHDRTVRVGWPVQLIITSPLLLRRGLYTQRFCLHHAL